MSAAKFAEPLAGPPIIFASGYADVDQVEAAVGPGAPLLRKPFSIHDLSDAIDGAVSGA
jgi:hypothetical protein